ncbi:hypothetical protein ES707_18056 [subsurface metagenome]
MAYLKGKRVKGKVYFQIVEAHREGGHRRDRVLLHLGRPRIPYVPGETIFDLEKFLSRQDRSDEQLNRVVKGLKFLMS